MSTSTPDTNTARVRQEIARAREILRARAEREDGSSRGDEAFVRRYLRILSLQAVGQFSEAMASLSEGVTALTASHVSHGERLTSLEQDLLALVRDLSRGGWPPDQLQDLAARVARLESGTAAAARHVSADALFDHIAAALREAVRPVGAGDDVSGFEIGDAGDVWTASASRRARVELASTPPDDLVDRPTGSVAVVSAVFLFDRTNEAEATRILAEVQRVLRPDGVLFAVFDPLQVSAGAHRTPGRRAVAAPGVLADIVGAAGLQRLVDVPLDEGGAGPRVIVASRT